MDDLHLADDRLAGTEPSEAEQRHLARCASCRGRRDAARASLAPPLVSAPTWSESGDDTLSLSSGPASSEPIRTVADATAIGREPVGRYDRLSEIGAGGMGRVDLVEDRHLGRRIALKEHSGRDAGQRFLREARITAQLEHPGVVPVYDLGVRADGRLYYTMRRVRGRTLAQALAERNGLEQRLGLLGAFALVCQTLGYAHGKGVVHRDLKPDNVMIGTHGEAVVLDWGLARATGDPEPDAAPTADGSVEIRSGGASMTRAGTVLGTVPYMSPEQAAGGADRCDARSDVWSLGVILYELLTGRRAFEGEDAVDILLKVQQRRFAPVASLCPAAPPELVAIVEKAMQAAPSDRYPTAQELAEDVECWRNGGRVGAYSYSRAELVGRTVRRYRLAIGGLGLAALASAVVVPTLAWQRNEAVKAQREAMAARDAALAAERASFTRTLLALAAGAEAEGHGNESLALARAALTEADAGGDADVARRSRVQALGLAERAGAQVLVAPGGAVEAVAFSPDGRQLLALQDGEATLWAVSDGTCTARATVAKASRLLWSPTSAQFTVFGPEGPDCVFDGASGARRYCVDGRVSALSFSPDGARLAAVGVDGIRVLAADTGALLASTAQPAGSVAWSPDGATLATAVDDAWSPAHRSSSEGFPVDPSVRLWAAADLAPTGRLAPASAPGILGFSDDGSQLLAARRVLRPTPTLSGPIPSDTATYGTPGADCFDLATGEVAPCLPRFFRERLLADGAGRLWLDPNGPPPAAESHPADGWTEAAVLGASVLGASQAMDGTEVEITDDGLYVMDGSDLVTDWDVRAFLHRGAMAVTAGRVALGTSEGAVLLFRFGDRRRPLPPEFAGAWPSSDGSRYVIARRELGEEPGLWILDTRSLAVARPTLPSDAATLTHETWLGTRRLQHGDDRWWMVDVGAPDGGVAWSERWPAFQMTDGVRFDLSFRGGVFLPQWEATVSGGPSCVGAFPRWAGHDRLEIRAVDDGSVQHSVTFGGPRTDALVLPDCARVASTTPDGRLEVRRADGGEPTWTVEVPGLRELVPSPYDGHVVVCDTERRGGCELRDSRDGRLLTRLPGPPTFSPSGALSATRSAGGVEVRDATGAIVRTWSFPLAVESLVLADDGLLLVHLDGRSDEVRVLDVPTGQVRRVRTEVSARAIGYDAEVQELVVVTERTVGRYPVDLPEAPEVLARTGAATNNRVCRGSLEVVPVLPFPPPETVWAPPEACTAHRE